MCCNPIYHTQLKELVAGTDISIEDLSNVRPDSMDFWMASGLFEHQGVHYRDDIDILGFVQKYFNAMGEAVNLGRPFERREDMLCAWPTLDVATTFRGILFINADPKSGQCPGYSSSEMDGVIERTRDKGHSVCAIDGANLTLAQIGRLSIGAKLIVGCATGPWWPTLNRLNRDTQRICMLAPMRLDYGSVPIVHAKNAAEVATIMEGMGFL